MPKLAFNMPKLAINMPPLALNMPKLALNMPLNPKLPSTFQHATTYGLISVSVDVSTLDTCLVS